MLSLLPVINVFLLSLFYKKQVRKHNVKTNGRKRKRAILLHALTFTSIYIDLYIRDEIC